MNILAFYLPQYHQIPENDKWWGEGFTEWQNVKKASPLFYHHNQPRIPLNNNYYDLSDIKTLIWQTKLAKKHGIDGFCFYHYWFNGKLLLEKPAELLLNNKEADLPFCFAWANEPWVRTWHGPGGPNEILILQRYGDKKEWEDHFMYFLKFFKDERYIKINNKPMLLIYHINHIKDSYQMIKTWEDLAISHGFDGVFLLSMSSWNDRLKPNPLLSGSVDFIPGKWHRNYKNPSICNAVHDWRMKQLKRLPNSCWLNRFFLNIVNYDKSYQEILKSEHKKNQFRCACVDYDDTARRGKEGMIYHGSTPDKFAKYLYLTLQKSKKELNDWVFINAWNEWGEGNYLEPDRKNGYGYLNAVEYAKRKFYQMSKKER